jgi:hypothetical protein
MINHDVSEIRNETSNDDPAILSQLASRRKIFQVFAQGVWVRERKAGKEEGRKE